MLFFKKKFKATLYIDGMSCKHCVDKVENALNDIDGYSAKVDLNKKCAHIKSNAPIIKDDVFNTIFTIGFTPTKIEI